MKTTLFYFSGTGNCLKLARDLAVELGEAEVVAVAKAIKASIDASIDRIGLVFPVYAFNPPLIILDFIDKLQAPPEKYIFAIITYAGVAANTFDQVIRQLEKKNLKLSAGFGIRMPGNYTPFYGAISLKRQRKLFYLASKRIKEIALIVKESRQQKIERENLFFRWMGRAIYPYVSSKMRAEDKNFWIDKNCNGCGICEKVCPVNNINLKDKKPLWLHKCEQCFACLQWCPQESIQYGAHTQGRKRYHHPAVTLADFLNVS
jgi:ferredoxin/flavodoxin